MQQWTQILGWLPMFLEGLKMTLLASLLSIVTSIVWGSFVAILLSLDNKFLNPIMRTYVSIFRNSPLLVQMFFIFYGLPYIGINFSPLLSGILAITLNEGAFISEILRGSQKNIPHGEIEAALETGLSRFQIIRLITFPLSFKGAIPALIGQSSIIIKDTSLLSLIMIHEITRAGNVFYSRTFNNISLWIVAAVYVLFFIIISYIGKYSEHKNLVRR